MSTKAEYLKQAIVERIRSGAYPVGSRLPGLRSAATEFGVHTNTAARVYSELDGLGIVRTVRGSGTFVLAVPGVDHGQSAIDEVFSTLRELAAQSRRLGLTRRDWARLVTDAEAAGYDGEDLTTWFVECSPKDMDDLATSLSALLERPVRPLLVDDLPHHLVSHASNNEFFITTPFHVEEVESVVGTKASVVTANVVLTSDTLIQFAQFTQATRFSVVAANTQTLDRLVKMIYLYTRQEPLVAALIDEPEANAVVREAEVIVDTQSIHQQVLAWQPRGEVVTVHYQIEPTSLAFLREVLRRKEAGRLKMIENSKKALASKLSS